MTTFPSLTYQLPGQREEYWDDSQLSPDQRAAVTFFEDNNAAIWAALCAQLQATVTAQEAEEAARLKQQMRAAASTLRESDEMLYGEHVDDGRGGFYDQFFESHDDEYEDPYDDEEPDSPQSTAAFLERFTLHGVVFLGTDRKGVCSLGFIGNCDWDEEHGLGIIMEGTTLTMVADQSAVR